MTQKRNSFSIHDYPEHLNPFSDESEENKKQKFFTLGRRSRSSFRDGALQAWNLVSSARSRSNNRLGSATSSSVNPPITAAPSQAASSLPSKEAAAPRPSEDDDLKYIRQGARPKKKRKAPPPPPPVAASSPVQQNQSETSLGVSSSSSGELDNTTVLFTRTSHPCLSDSTSAVHMSPEEFSSGLSAMIDKDVVQFEGEQQILTTHQPANDTNDAVVDEAVSPTALLSPVLSTELPPVTAEQGNLELEEVETQSETKVDIKSASELVSDTNDTEHVRTVLHEKLSSGSDVDCVMSITTTEELHASLTEESTARNLLEATDPNEERDEMESVRAEARPENDGVRRAESSAEVSTATKQPSLQLLSVSTSVFNEAVPDVNMMTSGQEDKVSQPPTPSPMPRQRPQPTPRMRMKRFLLGKGENK